MQPYFKLTHVICVPECPSCNVKNAAVNIYQGSIVQTCAVPSVLACRMFGHSCGMQSFISPVDHYAALLCDLQRAQWLFEQFLSTLKAALLQSECLLTSCFCAPLHRHSPLCQQHRYNSQIVFRLSTCVFFNFVVIVRRLREARC